MDFFKKSCKELCTRLWKDMSDTQKRITTTDELDKFIEAKCAEYDKKSKINSESDVIKKEKSYLNGIYKALEKQDTVEKLKELQKALKKLGSRKHVKFFSIFFGVGTGTYYREAAKKIEAQLAVATVNSQEIENLKQQKTKSDEELQNELKKQKSKETDNKKTKDRNKSIDTEKPKPYSVGAPDNKYLEELQERLPTGLNEITNQDEVPEELIELWCTAFKKDCGKGFASKIQVVKGDLTKPESGWGVDCIVNAAKETMTGGGGVDGAVHKGAGKRLGQYEKENHLSCPNYVAVPTPSFDLDEYGISKIIHVAAPQNLQKTTDSNRIKALWKCYANAIYCAAQLGCKNIAFPALGTGYFNDYLAISTMIAFEAAAYMLTKTCKNIRVTFVCYGAHVEKIYPLIYNKLQNELKKIPEEKKKQESKEKEKLKDLTESKDLFLGLPNGGNYCYLNTAIQNLYYDKSFSDKVLKTPIPDDKQSECKELYAVKVFFLYLAGKITLNYFNSLRKDLARDLGYDGSQANSLAMQQKLELTCKNQMKLLNRKTPIFDSESYTPNDKNLDLNKELDGWENITEPESPEDKAGRVTNILNSVRIMITLYEDISLRQQVMNLDKQDINIKEYDKFLIIVEIFNLIANGKFDSQQRDLVKELGNDQTFSGIKKYITKTIDAIKRSKKSRLLSKDSSIDIWPNKTIIDSINDFVANKVAENKAYHLPLKKNCFTVTLGDRLDGYRQNFTVEEDLDLESLVNSKKLKIFQKNEEIKKYKFKLISATIGTGGHYYIYRKIGNQWKKFNDSTVSNCNWESIKNNISGMCELLTYELVRNQTSPTDKITLKTSIKF